MNRIEHGDDLTVTITEALTGPTKAYREVVSADDPDVETRIALVRSSDRKAGRRTDVKVQTVAANDHGVIRLSASGR